MRRRQAAAMAAVITFLGAVPARAEAPLVLEAKIPLGNVFGRIDHMAVDDRRQRLFVAELGNDSLGVVDLKTATVIRRLRHMKEPQGVGYAASADTVFVAGGLDGVVRRFHGDDLAPAGETALDSDADDIRVDDKAGLVFVGHGEGGIAVLDAATGAKRADIALHGHPEGFVLAPAGDRIFVNVPNAREIAVIDRSAAKQSATWAAHDGSANFPMAIDDADQRVITVYRRPPRLVALSAKEGGVAAEIDTCGDADDVFADARRQRLYVSCGEGFIDVLQQSGSGYRRLAKIPTAPGARTALFDPTRDRLYVGVRAVKVDVRALVKATTEPAIWVFRPAP